jgi:HAD superfamily hydrolase (TIGR01509 family)
MDGLMFDTERLGWRLLNQASAEFGCKPICLERYTQAIGKTNQKTRKIFADICGQDYALYSLIEARFWELDRAFIRREGPPVKPGLIELLELLKKRAVSCALASSTHSERVAEHLHAAQLEPYFSVGIGGNQVTESKPAPDIFLEAAHRLGQPPERCLVLEDSIAGVQAGHSANMYVVMVPDIVEPTPEIRQKANLVVKSLTDVVDLIGTDALCFP